MEWAETEGQYARAFGQAPTNECDCLAPELQTELDTLLKLQPVVIMRNSGATKYPKLNNSLAKFVGQKLQCEGKIVKDTPFQYFQNLQASKDSVGDFDILLSEVKFGSVLQNPCLTLSAACSNYFCVEFGALSRNTAFTKLEGEAYSFLTSLFVPLFDTAVVFLRGCEGLENKSSMGKMFSAYREDPDSAVGGFPFVIVLVIHMFCVLGRTFLEEVL